MRAQEFISEEWSAKYKRSINCAHPRGFSQKAHCAGRKKNEDVTQYQVVCDGTKKGIFTDLDKAIKNAKSMFYHEKEYYHIAVVDLSTGKEAWSWSAPERDAELKEFAPGADDNRENNPEDVLFRFAQMWYSAPDVATQRRVEQALAKIGWDIGELESEEGGAFVMRIGDEDGNSYLAWSEEQLADQLNEGMDTDAVFEIDTESAYNAVMQRFGDVIEWSGDYMVAPRKYWPQIEVVAHEAGGAATEVTDDQLNELTFKGSPCTKDCSGHRAGYEWSQRKGGVDAASWSPSFNTGASLFKNGY